MSPKPFIENSDHDYSTNCDCAACFETERRRLYAHYAAEDPLSPARGIIFGLILSLGSIILALVLAGVIWTHVAKAREGSVGPVVVTKARAACPVDQPLKCRAALVHAYEAIEWQRDAREHAKATTVRDITRDAIAWAAEKYHVSAVEMIRVGTCESHLWPFATNGQYKGWAQLSTRHRTDPIFSVVPWQDAYGVASHVARYVKRYGWGEWQCRPEGGLRW